MVLRMGNHIVDTMLGHSDKVGKKEYASTALGKNDRVTTQQRKIYDKITAQCEQSQHRLNKKCGQSFMIYTIE